MIEREIAFTMAVLMSALTGVLMWRDYRRWKQDR